MACIFDLLPIRVEHCEVPPDAIASPNDSPIEPLGTIREYRWSLMFYSFELLGIRYNTPDKDQ